MYFKSSFLTLALVSSLALAHPHGPHPHPNCTVGTDTQACALEDGSPGMFICHPHPPHGKGPHHHHGDGIGGAILRVVDRVTGRGPPSHSDDHEHFGPMHHGEGHGHHHHHHDHDHKKGSHRQLRSGSSSSSSSSRSGPPMGRHGGHHHGRGGRGGKHGPGFLSPTKCVPVDGPPKDHPFHKDHPHHHGHGGPPSPPTCGCCGDVCPIKLDSIQEVLRQVEQAGNVDQLKQVLAMVEETVAAPRERLEVTQREKLESVSLALLEQKDLWIGQILPFLGFGYHAYLGATSKNMNQMYKEYCASVANPPMVPYTYGVKRKARATDTFFRAAFCSKSCAEYWSNDFMCNSINSSHVKMPSKHLVCGAIAKVGNMAVLHWAIQMGFPMNENTCEGAAAGGQLEVLQWLREKKGCPWNSHTCASAAKNGHLEILQWARANGCPWNKGTSCALEAAARGHLGVLQWVRDQGCPWSPDICATAAQGGHLEIIKWARDNGCPWSWATCSSAAGGGHLEILKWARDNGCPWDWSTCSDSAHRGHLMILRYAHQHGCPWDEYTCTFAAGSGHLEVLQYARQHGCPWYPQECLQRATANGHRDVVQWIESVIDN